MIDLAGHNSARWHVAQITLGEPPVEIEPYGPSLTKEIAAVAGSLAAEEGVVLEIELDGKASILLIVREDENIWLASRQKLRDSEYLEELVKTYSALARGSDATVITDVAGNLLAASSNWRKIYGYSLGELFGKNPRVINSRLQPSSFYQRMWQDLVNRDIGTWSAELINRRKNGELVRVWQTITTVRDGSGRIQGYLGQTRDMTSHFAVREQLERQNEKLEELNRFRIQMMEIMVHDLKSPLQSILGYTELIALQLNKENGGNESLSKKLKSIESGGRSMLELVQNFLELQRSNAGKLTISLQRGSLISLLRNLCESHSAGTTQRLTGVELVAGGPAVPAFYDPLRIEQAIGNLLSNAVKYTAEGTGVVVTVTNIGTGLARITVEDEGPGIPEDQLELIFEPYQQIESGKEFSGSIGWGLAIARRILELHGGTLIAENRERGGCRMVATLPLGYTAFYDSIHSVLLHDPSEKWCKNLLTFFERMEVPCFISSDASSFHQLCNQEIPAAILIDADSDCLPQELHEPEGNMALNPLVLKVSAETAVNPQSMQQLGGSQQLLSHWQQIMKKYSEYLQNVASY